jgi:serine/threonine-protein kinase
LGRYRIVAELARGSTSVVYLGIVAGPGGFNKLFALKQLRATLAEDPANVAMFLAEARLAGRLSHSNVVSTLEIEEQSALPYIVMEYLDGQPLFRAGARARMTGAPLSIPMQLAILNDAVEGLSYAHQALGYDGAPLRVVHRDVSPHNVFVTYGGQAKLLDFGIAQSCEAEGPRQGSPRGKVAYMSPEQAAGMNVDARADIFAIGVMLWEAVTAQRFWAQTTSEGHILELLASGRSPVGRERALAGAPPDLQYVIMNATEPDPADRYESAAALQADLQVVFRRMAPSGFNLRDVGRRLGEIFTDDRARLQAAIDTQLELVQSATEGAQGVPRLAAHSTVPPTPTIGSPRPVVAAFSPSAAIPSQYANVEEPRTAHPSLSLARRSGRGANRSGQSSPPSSGISPLRAAGHGVPLAWLDGATAAMDPGPDGTDERVSIDDDWRSDDALDAHADDRAPAGQSGGRSGSAAAPRGALDSSTTVDRPTDAEAEWEAADEASEATPYLHRPTAHGSLGAVATLPSVPIPVLPPARAGERPSTDRPPGTSVSIAPEHSPPTPRAATRLRPVVLVAALAGVLAAVVVSAVRDRRTEAPAARAAATPIATNVIPSSTSTAPVPLSAPAEQTIQESPLVVDRASGAPTPGGHVALHATDAHLPSRAPAKPVPMPPPKSVVAPPPAHPASPAPAAAAAPPNPPALRPPRAIDVTNPYSP